MSSNFLVEGSTWSFKFILLSFFLDRSLTSHQLKITLLILDELPGFFFLSWKTWFRRTRFYLLTFSNYKTERNTGNNSLQVIGIMQWRTVIPKRWGSREESLLIASAYFWERILSYSAERGTQADVCSLSFCNQWSIFKAMVKWLFQLFRHKLKDLITSRMVL